MCYHTGLGQPVEAVGPKRCTKIYIYNKHSLYMLFSDKSEDKHIVYFVELPRKDH